MSIHVWNCRCGRRWYRFARQPVDTTSELTYSCPGCEPSRQTVSDDWAEL